MQCAQAPQESRAAPAVFAAAPITAQHAQQAHLPTSLPQLSDAQDRAAAAAVPLPQRRAEATPDPHFTPMPQAVVPVKLQTSTGGPDSPMVHRSAESIVAKVPVKAASKAAAKAASKGKSAGDDGDEEDVELAPEEMGFAGHSDDAFAGKTALLFAAS